MIAVDVLLLVAWLGVVREAFVKVPAEAYAKALLECCWDFGDEPDRPRPPAA